MYDKGCADAANPVAPTVFPHDYATTPPHFFTATSAVSPHGQDSDNLPNHAKYTLNR